MKKCCITRIRIRTREIVAVASEPEAADQTAPTCPVCHSPLRSAPPAAAARIAEDADQKPIKKLKGDR